MDESKRTGLDETRRCLYIALQYLKDGELMDRELRGTIVNAIRHHHKDLGIEPPSTLTEYRDAIDAITAALGD